MSESRYFACTGTHVPFKGQGWHVIDRQTGKDVETLERGGFTEERARQLATLLNRAAQPSNVPQFWGNRWGFAGPNLIVHVECDRPRDRAAPGIVGRVRVNGRDFECLDVLTGPLPGKPMWIGEPIGLIVRGLEAE